MQSQKQLNKEEQEEYSRIRYGQNGLDNNTLELCLKYYLEYRNNCNGHIATDKLQLVFKSALFMAEKSQRVSNLKGQKMTLPSLSLGQLLRTHQLDEVMITLKDFSRHVKINDKEAAADLNNLIRQISFLITFHKKFEKSIEKLELRERGSDAASSEYLKLWNSFSWLLYIQAKNKVMGKSLDLIENTCMLAHTIAFMLTFAWDYLVPKAILRQEKRISQQSPLKEVIPILRDRVLEMFSIKTMDIFASVATAFQDFFDEELAKKGIIRSSQQTADFLSPEFLTQNYRKLDRLYEKSMGANDLDQRIFFRERLANLTPSKFTPFARQGYANKGRRGNVNGNVKQNFSSHRILNYELNDKIEATGKSEGIAVSRLPKAVLVSPSTMKVPLICATPITTGMEMFNYVNEKARKFNDMFAQGQMPARSHEPTVIKHMSLLLQKTKKDFDKKTNTREELIYSLFKLTLEGFIAQHPNDKDNEELFCAMMAISFETVLFVCNSPLTFEDVENQMGTSPFELWKACDYFLKFDKAMPSALKLHLLDIEVSLISYKMWRDQNMVEAIKDFANGERDFDIGNQFVQHLFKRVLHQTAFQIQQIGGSLKLQDYVQQSIFETMKYILSESTSMLVGRNIDQLIMCVLFALSRREKLQIRFSDIIQTYTDNNPHNKDIHEILIYKIPIEKREPINLISYYNQFFIHPLKEYILRQVNHENKKNYPNTIMQSPLRDILPREINRKNGKKATKDGNTNLLIAYTESPLLKHEALTFKGQPLQSKKVINFDQEQQNFLRKEEEKPKEYQKMSPRHLNLPPEINKKFSVQPQNLPWKMQQQGTSNMGGVTPSRLIKTGMGQGNYELAQFTTNPTPPTNQGKGMPKNTQYVMSTAFNKGNRLNH